MQAFTRLAKDFRLCDLRRSGCGWIRTTEAEKQQIYSLPHLATLEHTLTSFQCPFANLQILKSSNFQIFKFSNLPTGAADAAEPLVGLEPTTA